MFRILHLSHFPNPFVSIHKYALFFMIVQVTAIGTDTVFSDYAHLSIREPKIFDSIILNIQDLFKIKKTKTIRTET